MFSPTNYLVLSKGVKSPSVNKNIAFLVSALHYNLLIAKSKGPNTEVPP
jgi:hypothetical protein